MISLNRSKLIVISATGAFVLGSFFGEPVLSYVKGAAVGLAHASTAIVNNPISVRVDNNHGGVSHDINVTKKPDNKKNNHKNNNNHKNKKNDKNENKKNDNKKDSNKRNNNKQHDNPHNRRVIIRRTEVVTEPIVVWESETRVVETHSENSNTNTNTNNNTVTVNPEIKSSISNTVTYK